MGAMASKKASSVSPVRVWMAAESAGEVSGPVATMTLAHSGGGRPATSPRSMVTSGCASSCRVTSLEKPSRSTASAPPAGSLWRSPADMISEPARRISSCSRPTALLAASSERKLLEQTSSARPPVLCASVGRSGRISCSTTGTPKLAICHAASDPASPPPTMWMGAWGICRLYARTVQIANVARDMRSLPGSQHRLISASQSFHPSSRKSSRRRDYPGPPGTSRSLPPEVPDRSAARLWLASLRPG